MLGLAWTLTAATSFALDVLVVNSYHARNLWEQSIELGIRDAIDQSERPAASLHAPATPESILRAIVGARHE